MNNCIGIVAWIGYKYGLVCISSESGQRITFKYKKHPNWRLTRRESLGIPVKIAIYRNKAYIMHSTDLQKIKDLTKKELFTILVTSMIGKMAQAECFNHKEQYTSIDKKFEELAETIYKANNTHERKTGTIII